MKKLFCIKRDGKPVNGMYFENKQQAKIYRKTLNGVKEDQENLSAGFTVGIGPDHWRAA